MKRSPLSASRTPFIRLLVPLLAGIGSGEFLSLPGWVPVLAALGGVTLWILPIGLDNLEGQLRKRHSRGMGLFLLLFALGLGLYQREHRPIEMPEGEYPTAIVRIDHSAAEKTNTYYCPATLSALCDSCGKSVKYEMPIALYLEKSLQARRLQRGDLIVIPFAPEPIQANGNPDEMDYVKFMRHRGIEHSQFLRDNQWNYLGRDKADLRSLAADWQESLVRQLRLSHLSPHSMAMLEAMLLGESQEVPQKLRYWFSSLGISHILAVSGLHIGILAMLLYWILYPLTIYRLTRKWRALITLLILWIYCFITGLSPSAVRATIMGSFLLIAELIERRNSSLNALLAAAFFMLLYDPDLLFHAGFQLSFAAVASILLFYHRLNVWGHSPYPLVRWLSSTVAVSIASQIGTLPLSIYYFHTIPLLFLIGNLAVLPLLPFILGSGLLLLFLSYLQLPSGWLEAGIDMSLNFIEHLSYRIYQLPGGHLAGVWLESRYLWAYIIGGILLYIAFRKRSKHLLWGTLGLGIAFLVADLYNSRPNHPELIVYDDNRQTVVELSEGRNAYLMLTDSLTLQELTGNNHRMRQGRRNVSPVYRNSPEVQQGNIFVDYPFAQFHGKTILQLDSIDWRYRTTARPLTIDYAIIDEGFQGKIKELAPLFTIRHAIITSRVHPSRAYHLIQQCRTLNIPCHHIRTQGAWIKEIP